MRTRPRMLLRTPARMLQSFLRHNPAPAPLYHALARQFAIPRRVLASRVVFEPTPTRQSPPAGADLCLVHGIKPYSIRPLDQASSRQRRRRAATDRASATRVWMPSSPRATICRRAETLTCSRMSRVGSSPAPPVPPQIWRRLCSMLGSIRCIGESSDRFIELYPVKHIGISLRGNPADFAA